MKPVAKLDLSENSSDRDDMNGFPRPVPEFTQKRNPRLGCAGIVRRGSDVLLGQRNKDPNRGLWVLPGGRIDFLEPMTQTLQRELAEETGLDVEVEDFFQVSELITPPDEHRVIIYMNARYRSGKPMASSDLSDVRFFSVEELKKMSAAKMISPFVEKVLREAKLL
jgi:8-oxo-dGTP diphosphatase